MTAGQAGDRITDRMVYAAHAAWMIALGKCDDVHVVMTTGQAQSALRAAIAAAFAMEARDA